MNNQATINMITGRGGDGLARVGQGGRRKA